MWSRGTVVATTVAAFALLAAPASAADVRIAEIFDLAGDPGLLATAAPAEGSQLEWRRCAGGGPVCEPLPAGAYAPPFSRGVAAYAGETPAGTVFEAVSTTDGVETKVRTRPWQGRVTATSPPALQGEAVTGKPVTVAQGTWSGGWGPGPELTTTDFIFACREPSGADCWLISYDGTVTPEPRWAGWYLVAEESRYAGNGICHALFGCAVSASVAALPVRFLQPRVGATFARSAPLGPLAAPVAKAPTAALRTRALRRNGRLRVGRVTCEVTCKVRLTVSGGGRRALRRTLAVTGVKALTVPLRRGKLTVRVVVDGKALAAGRTTYGVR